MRRIVRIALVSSAMIAAGGGVILAAGAKFDADLSGSEEVPARVTGADGEARFKVRGDSIEFKLRVDDLSNLWMAHIHLAGAGTNGPIAVWLLPHAAPPPPSAIAGVSDGWVARGTITAADLVGPLAGQSLDALVAAIEAGNAYVNVHTNDFVDPPNTGPGDFPGGEIRGQLHDH